MRWYSSRLRPTRRSISAPSGRSASVMGTSGMHHLARAAAGELRVQLDHAADIEHDHERRAAFARQFTRGRWLACERAASDAASKAEALPGPELLGFKNERAARVAVDAARRGGAVVVSERDRALELAVLGAVWQGDAERRTPFGDELLRRRQLGAAGQDGDTAPTGDEPLDVARDPLCVTPCLTPAGEPGEYPGRAVVAVLLRGIPDAARQRTC